MFTTLVVPLDLTSDGDRALPVARALADLGDVDVELVTVAPSAFLGEAETFEMSRRATENGWPADAYHVLIADDAADAIVEHVRGREGTLLMMSTRARRPPIGHFLGSVSEKVLQNTDRPILLVGPRVPEEIEWSRPTPILCVDESDTAAQAVPIVAAWTSSFRSAEPWVVEVMPADDRAPTGDTVAAAHAYQVAQLLSAAGVPASWEVLYGSQAALWLDDFADRIDEPFFVAASTRWTDGRTHWHSETRQLVHRSTRPVLVAPVHVDRATAAPGPSAPMIELPT
jgi:nucleotide-binding universal stress UspA family protein